MSDASDAFASPVVRKVGGEDVEFPRLVGTLYGQLESAVKEKMAAVDRELLDECEVVGKERFDKLRETANFKITMGHVNEALLTYEFARKALEISLKKAKHPSIGPTLDKMETADMSDLARELVGFIRPFVTTSQPSGTGSTPPSDATTPESTPAS